MAIDPQIEWIAALNGMTAQQWLDSQARTQIAGQQSNPQSGAIASALWDVGNADDAYVAGLGPRTSSYQGQLAGITSGLNGIASGAQGRAQQLQGINTGLGQQSWASAQTANRDDLAALGSYGTAIGNAGAWDLSNFQTLQQAAAAPMQMNATGYVGDAQSNAADVARQMQVFGQLQGAANGSLDVQSQAARAYANAQDVANQQAAAAMLQRSGAGALNVNLQNIRELDKLRDPTQIEGMGDLRNIYNGALDMRAGGLDPVAFKAAHEQLAKLQGLTDPSITAAERAMMEISRRQQEQDEGAVRAALDTQMQRRGSYSSGSAIARSSLSAQQTSQNRMLADMMAQKNAQERAMQALQGAGALSSNLTAQANDMAARNQATRAGAMNQYSGISGAAAQTLGQIGAQNATQNANRQLAAQQAAYQAYAELRAQGFSEEYARGKAADIVAQGNQQTRLGAMNTSAGLSTSMRNASDAMSMFNQGQRQQQQQFSDNYTANRQDAQFGRAVAVNNSANTVGRNYVSDQTGLFNANTGVNAANNARNQQSIQTQQGLNNDWMSAYNNADNTAIGVAGINRGLASDSFAAGEAAARAPGVLGRQKVQDATTIRNLGVSDQANAAQLAAAGGGPVPGSAQDPEVGLGLYWSDIQPRR